MRSSCSPNHEIAAQQRLDADDMVQEGGGDNMVGPSSHFGNGGSDCQQIIEETQHLSTASETRWDAESDMARQRPFSYVDQSQFNKHNRYYNRYTSHGEDCAANNPQHEVLLLSDPYLSSNRARAVSTTLDSGDNPARRSNGAVALHRSTLEFPESAVDGDFQMISHSQDNVDGGRNRSEASKSSNFHVEDRTPLVADACSGADGGRRNSQWNVDFPVVECHQHGRSSRFLGSCMRVPCASLWSGVFVIAEVVAFCIISSSMASASVARIQQILPANQTEPGVQYVRALYSAILSLIAVVQILAVIAHVLVAAAAANRPPVTYGGAPLKQRSTSSTDVNGSLMSRGGGIASLYGKRQLIKHICFKLIQLLLILTFFALFLFWLLVSLALAAVFSLVVVAPEIALSCESAARPDGVMNPSTVAYAQQVTLWRECAQALDEPSCELLRNIVCILVPDWMGFVPLLLGCSVLLVISILITLCCQSLNYGRSALPAVTAAGYTQRDLPQRDEKKGAKDPSPPTQHKPFDRVLAELWRDPRTDKALGNNVVNAPESNGRLL